MAAVLSRKSGMGTFLVVGLLVTLAWHFVHRSVMSTDFVGGSSSPVSERVPKVACRGIDKVLQERVQSVQKTAKLTDAMRLVAAAKVRRAQDGVEKARPFSNELQSMIKGLVKKLKGSGLEQELPMLRVPEKVSSVGMLLVTSNRGLCGAYNTFVMKRALARTKELNAQGIEPKIAIVGKKANILLRSRFDSAGVKYNNTGIFFPMPDQITAKSSNELSETLRNLFLSGEVDKVEVVYAKFFTLLKNSPSVRSLLPLSPTGIEDPEDETFSMTSEDGKLKVEKEKVGKVAAKEIENDVIFDQAPATILNSMLPLYLNSQLLSILYDAQASELSSRMTAMKAATDNADNLVVELTAIMNKKRQASITQELLEICAGGMATETATNKAGPALGVFDSEESILDDFMTEIETGSLPDAPEMPSKFPEITI
jgi:F-type H+-transporting ATPase subunit gamma